MFKNAFISSLITGFVFLLTFGATIAFGENPSVAPPGGLVHPTFSGVNIAPGGYLSTGGIMSPEGDLVLTKKIPGSGDGGNDSAFIRITDTPSDLGDSVILIGSEIPNKNITITTGEGGKIFMNDPVEAYSLKILDSIFSGSGPGDAFPLTINDDIEITGDLTVDSISTLTDHTNLEFTSPVKFTDSVTFGSDPSFPNEASFQILNVSQKIINPLPGDSNDAIVNIDEGLYVSGKIVLNDKITDYDDGDVNIGENLVVEGDLLVEGDIIPGISASDACSDGQILRRGDSTWTCSSPEDAISQIWAESTYNVYRVDKNVGIGINDPKHKLDVVGGSGGQNSMLLRLRNPNTSYNTGTGIRFTNTTTNSSNGTYSSEIVGVRGGGSSQSLEFKTSNSSAAPTTRMTIAGGGNVTINESLTIDEDLMVNGGIYTDTNIAAGYGHITADKIGKYFRERESESVSGDSYETWTNYCSSGKVVSCHVRPDTTNANTLRYYAQGMHANPNQSLTYCEARVFNDKSTALTFHLDVICFDPKKY